MQQNYADRRLTSMGFDFPRKRLRSGGFAPGWVDVAFPQFSFVLPDKAV